MCLFQSESLCIYLKVYSICPSICPSFKYLARDFSVRVPVGEQPRDGSAWASEMVVSVRHFVCSSTAVPFCTTVMKMIKVPRVMLSCSIVYR